MMNPEFMSLAFLLAAAFWAALSGPAAAEDPGAAPAAQRALLTAEAQTAFLAVGRLNLAGQGHCTATLIGPDLAVTAAHCLDARRAGAALRPETLHFLPGWRMGAFAAHRRGAAVARAQGDGVATDLGLIGLDAPVPVAPLPLAARPARTGEAVAVVSYGRDRAQAPSLQTGCRITARQGPVLVTDCEALPGVSGAPLLRAAGVGWEVVGVVSARTGSRAAPSGAALAVALDAHLPALRAQLEAGR